MNITRDSLLTLEAYARARPALRHEVLAEKQRRRIALGEHLLLIFESELLIRYQIQEMLRIERIFEEDGIRHELNTYAPLVPDGHNLKATLQIEYPDEAERRRMLWLLKGIEHRIWISIGDAAPVYAIADEDLERETEDKTSAVHFLRFEFTPAMCAAARAGAPMALGVEHAHYQARLMLPSAQASALAQDFKAPSAAD